VIAGLAFWLILRKPKKAEVSEDSSGEEAGDADAEVRLQELLTR
jgi:hypothetical protein